MSLLLREQSLDILHLYATRAARRLVGAPFASRLGPHGPRGAAIIVSVETRVEVLYRRSARVRGVLLARVRATRSDVRVT